MSRGETYKVLEFTLVLDTNVGSRVLFDDLEGPVLHILLDFWVIDLATNETLGIEDGVLRVGGILVLRSVTDSARKRSRQRVSRRQETQGCLQSLIVAKADPRRGNTVTLVVGQNFDAATTLHTGSGYQQACPKDVDVAKWRVKRGCSEP